MHYGKSLSISTVADSVVIETHRQQYLTVASQRER